MPDIHVRDEFDGADFDGIVDRVLPTQEGVSGIVWAGADEERAFLLSGDGDTFLVLRAAEF